jgi:hypothetical protein
LVEETIRQPDEDVLTWRLNELDFDGPLETGECAWNGLLTKDLAQLKRDLVEYETRTMRAMRSEKKLVSIPFPSLRQEAQDRLRELELEDEHLWHLRLGGVGGKRRVWGLLYANVFHLVWWDPLHQIARGKDRKR